MAGFLSPLFLLGAGARPRLGYPSPLPLLFGYAGEVPPDPEPEAAYGPSGIPTFIDYYDPEKRRGDDDILWLTPHGG